MQPQYLTSRDFAEKNGLKYELTLKVDQSPELTGDEWEWATTSNTKNLSKTGLSMDEIDVIELNEAFAAQSLYVIQKEMGYI